ncbi:MAG: hypothetical protein AAFZ18_29690 [Myxococcota bacterium]
MSLVVVCAYLLGGHLLTLPTPALGDPKLRRAVSARRSPSQWLALHVLYGDCGCSRRVVRHLARRGPTSLAREHVVIVDPRKGDLEDLREAGFTVERTEREALDAEFGVAAAPLLVIADASGAPRYIGGYTDRKRGPSIEDLAVLRSAQAGDTPEPLPLFGCAVNTTLARQVDPLGLR